MNKLSNEVRIGLVALAAIFVAYLGFRIMRDEPIFSNINVINTKFENVNGLIQGGSVYLNGYKIGTVKEMRFLVDSDSTEVVLNINEPVPIPVGSKAVLVSPGPIGSGSIEIKKSKNAALIDWGGYIEGVNEAGLLDVFAEKGSSLSDSVAQTLTLTNSLLKSFVDTQQQTSEDITGTISNFRETSDVLRSIIEERQEDVNSMIADAQNTLKNVSELSDTTKQDLQEMISNLESFSGDLEVLSAELKASTESINSILTKIDEGDGTIGKMINDPSLYNNMDSLTVNLNELIKGIQEDPRRYLKHMRLVDFF